MNLKTLSTRVLLLLATLLICVSAPAQSNTKRTYRIGVFIPEQHLERKVPDPAVETRIRGLLIEEGFKIMDIEQAMKLKMYATVDKLIDNTPGSLDEAIRLARGAGVDILVVGEAFSEEVARQNVETELGNTVNIRCRARIELRAYKTDTAEIIFSDSLHQTGPPEPTVPLSSKAAFDAGARSIAPSLIDKLSKLPNPTWARLEVEIRNITLTQGTEIRGVLKSFPGMIDIEDYRFESGNLKMEVKLLVSLQKDLATKLETSPKLKKYKLKVQTANNTKVIASRK